MTYDTFNDAIELRNVLYVPGAYPATTDAKGIVTANFSRGNVHGMVLSLEESATGRLLVLGRMDWESRGNVIASGETFIEAKDFLTYALPSFVMASAWTLILDTLRGAGLHVSTLATDSVCEGVAHSIIMTRGDTTRHATVTVTYGGNDVHVQLHSRESVWVDGTDAAAAAMICDLEAAQDALQYA